MSAQIITTDAGGGLGGGSGAGTGGMQVGTGGAAGDGSGTGGSGTGGNGSGGGTGIDAGSVGGNGMGGNGTGGADAGVDGPVDGPTGITPYAMGQLVITEVMADTNDTNDEMGEWFELYNPSTTVTYDLMGCDLSDKANHDVVLGHVLVPPQTYVTMARFGTLVGGFLPTYNYHTTVIAGTTTVDPNADVKFSNSGDAVAITCGITQIDGVVFMTWLTTLGGVPNGRSYSLDPSHYSATENDVEGNWCVGTTTYKLGGTDRGTPNQANPSCTCMDGSSADGGLPNCF